MFKAPLAGGAYSDGSICRMCMQPGSDVRMLACGCELHGRCVPLNLIVSEVGLRNNETKPVAPNSLLCPCCRTSSVSGIYLFPLSTDDLDRAVSLRKETLLQQTQQQTASGGSAIDLGYIETQAETSYLLLSHNQGSSSVSSDHEYQRTGRWTDEEITYVDFLVEAFDNGRFPVEHGLKLNEFLANILLCKSSRLTKKMKNARLSIRSYNFASPVPSLDVEVLSSLEQKFIESISSEASRLELKFNLSRLWRSHLSNLCLQVGSGLLDANDWIASLEDVERRASDAEEKLRKARRRRMGLALRTDVRNKQDGVFFGGIPVQRPPKKAKTERPEATTSSSGAELPRVTSVTDTSSNQSLGSSESEGEADFISSMLDVGDRNDYTGADDYSQILEDLAGGQTFGMPKLIKKNCGPFLEELVHYVESNHLPFQHVDVWVPSYRQGGSASTELRLFHAGYSTSSLVDSARAFQLDEYGEYSTRFSFAPGVGLPGRVFSTGKPVWERNIDEADPKYFERSGGAKIYGVKTGFGLALRTNVIGLIVVSMYSVNDLAEDPSVVQKCMADLSKLCPEPKWKLVVEMGDGTEPSFSSEPGVRRPGSLVHVQHSSNDQETGSSQAASESVQEEDMEQQIAGMLGEFMPLMDIPSPGESTNSTSTPTSLVPHFMSLRLLLLRAPARRTEQEAEMVDLIKRSYEGYIKDGRRGKRDVAMLLVRDWQFLKNTMVAETKKPSAQPALQHQSHTLEAPLLSTYASSGAPVAMPKALPFVDPTTVRRSSSFDKTTLARERFDSDASSTSFLSLNIVENVENSS